MELEGKIAIVTGAGADLGRAAAIELASRGATVVCAGTDLARAEDTARAIEERDGSAQALEVDPRRDTEAAWLVRSTVQRFGRLDILVNNAGLEPGPRGAALGVYYGIRHGAPAIAAVGGGAIVNISSVLGRPGALAGCAAARHGVVGLTRSFALGYAGRRVRINALCPADSLASALEPFEADEPYRLALESEPAFAHLEGPEDVAKAIAFLAGEGAAQITGVTVPVGSRYLAR